MVTYNIVNLSTPGNQRRVYGQLKLYSPLNKCGYIKLNLINRYNSGIVTARNKRIGQKILALLLEEGYGLEDLSITSLAINRTAFRSPSRIRVKTDEEGFDVNKRRSKGKDT